MNKLAITIRALQWLAIFSCGWIGQVFAIGETCSQIWTQPLRSESTVPAWASCFGTNSACYNVSGTSMTSLPSSMMAGDYIFDANTTIPANSTVAASGATVRIFIKGSLTIDGNVRLNHTGPAQNLLLVVAGSVTIRNNARMNGFILAGGALTVQDNVIINGGITAKGAITSGVNNTFTFDSTALSLLEGGVICSLGLSCVNDNFNSNVLSSNWAVSRSSGLFTPSVVNGRLRMTESKGDQSTAASYQRLFPGLANLVIVEFNQFAYGRTGSEGADGMAVVLSDASIAPQPGAFGGPLGYGMKPGPPVIPGFAGGWLGVGIDEYGNFSAEGGVLTPGRRRQAVVLRGSGSGSTGYRYLAGTCSNGNTNTNGNCLSPAVDSNGVAGHRYRVTIDSRVGGQAMVKVERNTGGGYQTLINSFNALSATGQAPVPANFVLSLTGSTGGANNIHELDDLQICALKSEPVGELIDHFELSYSGQALTCKAEVFTVKACKNPSCTELVTGPVSATLSPATGWISGTGLTGGHVLNFSGGTATATLSQTTVANVIVGVSASTPVTKPFSTTLCQKGAALPTADCRVPFADSGLVFSVPDKLAAKPVSGIVVKAVRKDNISQTCQPGFTSVSRTVKFWSGYVNPATPSAEPAARVTITNGPAIQAIGTTEATATNIPLSFNANGEATIGLNYADAGQLNLDAKYTGTAATNDAGLVLTGADAFVSAPAGLCITADNYCEVLSADCPFVKKTGENFTATLRASAWKNDNDTDFCDNATTPSFSLNAIPLRHQLLLPTAGAPGSLSESNYNHVAQKSAQTPVVMNLSEVGIFGLEVGIAGQAGGANLTYLGMPINLRSSMPYALNRIVPHHFKVQSNIMNTSTCDKFHYLSQPALLDITVEALNHEGKVTQNYHGAFATATASLVAENNNKVDLTSRIQPPPMLLDWVHGRSERTAQQFSLLRANTVDGSFESVLFGLKLAGNDGTPLADLDQRVDTADDCVAANNCLSKTLGVAKPWRYGRLQIVNALGSEQSNLPVQIKAEYWNSQQFVPNTDDHCSPVQPARLQVTAITPGAPVLTVNGNNSTLQNGNSPAFDLLLSPPDIESRYLLQYQLDGYPWLQFDWDPNNPQLLENPSGEAVFGGFRGNNRQIFWREN